MPLPAQWARPEDFATLFQYFWHRDFPIDREATGAHRADWTIHIGVVVRNLADLLGLYARFEAVGRKDAVLRAWSGDEVAVEWEWEGVRDNELDKLRDPRRVWKRGRDAPKQLKYAVLITYSQTQDIDKAYEHVKERWEKAPWPLLLILIDFRKSRKFSSGRELKNINISVFDSSERRDLRAAPAFPWNVEESCWASKPSE